MSTQTKKNEYEVGGIAPVPMHLSAGTLTVECVIVDERQVFGRHEIQVTPVNGEGLAWVRVDRIVDGKGPTADRSKGWQRTHNAPVSKPDSS
jgi:hypothetical protein